jgi:hypothetical protein
VQIAATKSGQMEIEGIPVQRFFDHAIAMALRTLKP